MTEMIDTMTSKIKTNNLKEFKNYIDNHKAYAEAIIKESNDLILYNLIEYTKE